MSRQINHIYEFGPFRLDSAEHLLLREGEPVPLRPKVFDILLVLVENRGHLVEKNKLMNAVWPNTFVEEANLNKNISMLRQALGENQSAHEYIETVPKLGYRFIAAVKELESGTTELLVQRHTRSRIVAEEEEEEEETDAWSRQPPPSASVGATTRQRSNAEFGITTVPLTQTEQLVTTSRFESVRSAIKRHQMVATLFLGVLTVIAAIVVVKFIQNQSHPTRPLLQTFKLTRLTTSGRALMAAISPDGKYVAHVMEEKRLQALWLRQIGESHDVQIVPAANVMYWSVTFSPDNNHVYFISWEKNKTDAALYRVPVLGGLAKQLVVGIGSSITFSPDGQRIAYVNDYSRGQSKLMMAQADGTAEQVLLARTHPDAFSHNPTAGPAWSPDGKYIISAAGRNGYFNELVVVRLEDRTQTQLTPKIGSSVKQIVWLEDSGGLIITARADGASPRQIWHVSYPGGDTRRITNDLTDYDGVSLSRNSNMMVTVQTEQITELWVAPDADTSHAKRLASEIGTNMIRENLSWTPDGRIVYCSNAGGHIDLWVMDENGANRRQLTSEAGNNIHPTVSPDGRHIVFASDRTGAYRLWRMNIGTGVTNQLTNTSDVGEAFPHYSPDGRWVVYQQGYGSATATLWKVTADGGTPVQLTNTVTMRPAISPDGRLIAYYYMDDEVWGLAVIPFDGGPVVRKFVMPPTVESRIVHWSTDGSALFYLETREGVSNIWSQPLRGGPPRKLTNFESSLLSYFDWSRDGKHLAFTNSSSISDVVLLNFD